MRRLIDADALMVVLEKIPAVGFKNIDNQTYTLVLLAQVLNIIKKQPTIERKTGEWIDEGFDRETGYEGLIVCSECGEEGNLVWDFCPICGADMRGGNDE